MVQEQLFPTMEESVKIKFSGILFRSAARLACFIDQDNN